MKKQNSKLPESKEKSSDQPAEIRLSFEREGLVLNVGDQAFLMPIEEYQKLMDRAAVLARIREMTRVVIGKNEIEKEALIMRLLRKGLDMSRIAKALDMPEAEVRALHGRLVNSPGEMAAAEHAANLGEAQSEDYCKCWVIDNRDGTRVAKITFIDFRALRSLYRQGKDPVKVWNLDPVDFMRWEGVNTAWLSLL